MHEPVRKPLECQKVDQRLLKPVEGQGQTILDTKEIEHLFAELHEAVGPIASRLENRISPAARRVSGAEDWSQNALLTLWRKVVAGDLHLRNGSDLLPYLSVAVRYQALTSMREMERFVSLSVIGEDVPVDRAQADALSTTEQEAQKAAILLQVSVTEEELLKVLAGLPVRRAAAAGFWLGGMSFVKAADITGVSEHQVRITTFHLGRGSSRLAGLVQALKNDLGAFYHAFPSAAAEVFPRTLERLLKDDRKAPHWRQRFANE
jgi:DNA-directed RNA polymerase specialized sigma24 family protein